MAERHTVDVDVVGSKPITHPKKKRSGKILAVFVYFHNPSGNTINLKPLTEREDDYSTHCLL